MGKFPRKVAASGISSNCLEAAGIKGFCKPLKTEYFPPLSRRSSQQLAVSQNIFTAKDAEPLHQAKTWARREPPGAKGMGLYRRSARMSVDWDEEEGASESLDADTRCWQV
jgi:hypothetical protein